MRPERQSPKLSNLKYIPKCLRLIQLLNSQKKVSSQTAISKAKKKPSTQANARRHNASPCKCDNESGHRKSGSGKQSYQILNMWMFGNAKHLARVGPDNDVVIIRIKLLTAGDKEASNVVAAVIQDILSIAGKISGGRVDSLIILRTSLAQAHVKVRKRK